MYVIDELANVKEINVSLGKANAFPASVRLDKLRSAFPASSCALAIFLISHVTVPSVTSILTTGEVIVK